MIRNSTIFFCLLFIFQSNTYAENRVSIDTIKDLAGVWESVEASPHLGKKSTSIFRVTSGGSAVEEILFAGTSNEMINIYHQEGETLGLTHYCMLKNQPHLHARRLDNKTIRFEYADGGNIDPEKDWFMSEVTITFLGKNRILQQWKSTKDGSVEKTELMEMRRKTG